jgi:hypothetical protein
MVASYKDVREAPGGSSPSVFKQIYELCWGTSVEVKRLQELAEQANLQEELGPQAVAPRTRTPKPSHLAISAARWRERLLLKKLLGQDPTAAKWQRWAEGDGARELVTANCLASELEKYGTVSNSDRLQLQAIIERVAEDARGADTCSQSLPPEHRPSWATAGLPEHYATPEDSVRVCGRSDANMRELLQLVVGLDEAARNVEEHLNREPTWARDDMSAQVHLQQQSAEHTPTSPVDGKGNASQLMIDTVCVDATMPEDRRQPESPEPEPCPAFVDPFQAQESAQYLKDRMNSSAAAQGSRLHSLEVAIDNLAQRIKPILNAGSAIDPQRFDALEQKAQLLADTLAPILRADFDIAEASQPNYLRAWAGDLG